MFNTQTKELYHRENTQRWLQLLSSATREVVDRRMMLQEKQQLTCQLLHIFILDTITMRKSGGGRNKFTKHAGNNLSFK